MGKSEDTRFVQRVLNASEQRQVFASTHPDIILWALWAAKETAFKAVSKAFPDVSSAPRCYPVELDSKTIRETAQGRVMTPHGSVEIKIDFQENYVHCIGIFGASDNFESIHCHIEETDTHAPQAAGSISEKESLAVRRLAIENIAKSLHMNARNIRIIRSQAENRLHPPAVYVDDKRQNIEISLSHAGRFAACAFLIKDRHIPFLKI